MKTINLIIVTVLIAILSLNISAQKEVKDSNTIVRPVQISFVTPLGTNGMESWKVINNFSLNMFAGYNGGVQGVEIAGFHNQIKEDVVGLQIAVITPGKALRIIIPFLSSLPCSLTINRLR